MTIRATYLRHMGTDLDVVNNARVSFLKTSNWDETTGGLKATDKRLIQFLARGMTTNDYEKLVNDLVFDENMLQYEVSEALWRFRNTPTHWVPFANGIRITFHVVAPIPIMRQLYKSKVGGEESEVSRRYVSDDAEFFFPEWRQKAENVKQGSGGVHPGEVFYEDDISAGVFSIEGLYKEHVLRSKDLYRSLIKGGVAPEQARFVLPQGAMTEAIVSHSLYGWARFYNQRTDSHAQKEIQDLAQDIRSQVEPLFPVSWEALTQPEYVWDWPDTQRPPKGPVDPLPEAPVGSPEAVSLPDYLKPQPQVNKGWASDLTWVGRRG